LLIPQDLKNVSDLLKNLPSQAPALLALTEALVDIHMFTGTYIRLLLSTALAALEKEMLTQSLR
jgi:hypothetical protein